MITVSFGLALIVSMLDFLGAISVLITFALFVAFFLRDDK